MVQAVRCTGGAATDVLDIPSVRDVSAITVASAIAAALRHVEPPGGVAIQFTPQRRRFGGSGLPVKAPDVLCAGNAVVEVNFCRNGIDNVSRVYTCPRPIPATEAEVERRT